MKVVVLHSCVPENAGEDEQDVLIQVQAVSRALSELGHEVGAAPFSIDLRDTVDGLRIFRPDLAFNLVETIEGSGRLIHIAPSVLDHLRIPYTGANTEALFLTSNKLLAKKMLKSSGILTPPWVCPQDAQEESPALQGAWIVKSVWEHASVGLDEDSVIPAKHRGGLFREMQHRRQMLGGDAFAEVFVEGREFNVSLLGGEGEPQILPPAEIRFDHYPAGKARVVGYRAKWETRSFEYHHTPRCFDFPPEDEGLIRQLSGIAKDCWRLFGLRGYARVDFRVDETGVPWVLEVNANPCLSPDAGFAAACRRAGLDFKRVVERIVNESWNKEATAKKSVS